MISREFAPICCLRYCKSTIFQANHNAIRSVRERLGVVCDTAKVRFFKQITTVRNQYLLAKELFAILQKYDFSSKSQLIQSYITSPLCCLRYCKSTIFQANHNYKFPTYLPLLVVCDTAKVRFFKQITTCHFVVCMSFSLFAILQKYDFSSKSQHSNVQVGDVTVVCDTAKVRFFKQITT